MKRMYENVSINYNINKNNVCYIDVYNMQVYTYTLFYIKESLHNVFLWKKNCGFRSNYFSTRINIFVVYI